MDRMELLAALILGFLLDQLLGDPQISCHPVRLLGNLIRFFERHFFRWGKGKKHALLAGGAFMAVTVCVVTAFFVQGLLFLAGQISPVIHFAAKSLLCYSLYAAKDLRVESMNVYQALKENGLEEGRKAVSMIVGRDVSRLDEAGVIKAAVETVAENTSDGVIAPLFYMAIGGPVLGWVYKAINTMDSMVGYKNETYLYFGRAAARLDDAANFLPSRLSALFMVAGAFLCGLDGPGAWKIFLRDRKNHASPNSAQTEAACAGALGVQLAGDAWYFGVLHKKKTIGDSRRPVEAEDIKRANRLMMAAVLLSLFLAAGLQLFLAG